MSLTAPRSIRFDPAVTKRLIRYVAVHPGLSAAAATNRMVDEGLRIEEHPGIFFRSGASGRRAVLVGGPDVWEVIRAVHSARSAERELSSEEVIRLVSDTSGVPERMVRIAISYWAVYSEEVESDIKAAETAADEAFERWERERGLLTA